MALRRALNARRSNGMRLHLHDAFDRMVRCGKGDRQIHADLAAESVSTIALFRVQPETGQGALVFVHSFGTRGSCPCLMAASTFCWMFIMCRWAEQV